MSSKRHNECQVFANKNVDAMTNPGCSTFLVLSDKQIRAHFKHCQIKTHVKTTRISLYWNMDFRSFDNELKQLYEYVSMQED